MQLGREVSPAHAASPDRSYFVALVVGAMVAAAVLIGTAMLWAHYGTAVFFEMIATGIAACF